MPSPIMDDCVAVHRYGTHALPIAGKCQWCHKPLTEPEVLTIIRDLGYYRPMKPDTSEPF